MNEESKVFGVSVRAFIAIMVAFTLCGMSWMELKIVEPFYSVGLFVIGFFFGQKKVDATNGGAK